MFSGRQQREPSETQVGVAGHRGGRVETFAGLGRSAERADKRPDSFGRSPSLLYCLLRKPSGSGQSPGPLPSSGGAVRCAGRRQRV